MLTPSPGSPNNPEGVSSDKGSRVVARGSVKDRPVPRLLHQIHGKRLTGHVTITDGSDTSEVYLRDGAPVHVNRPNDVDRLDRILVDLRLAPAAAVARAHQESRRLQRRLGEVLLEHGALTPQGLGEALRAQLRRKVTRLFFVHDGVYEIFAEPHPFGEGEDETLMRLDPRCLIYPGIQVAYDAARLTAELAPLLERRFRLVKVAPGALEAMGFAANDPTIAALRAAALTLGDLTGLPAKLSEAQAVVLALLYTDLLDVERLPVSAAAPTPTPPSPPAADARLRATIVDLHAALDTLAPHELLGVAANAGEAEVKAAYLKAVRQLHPDRLAGAGLRELGAQAERIVARMTEAQALLTDPARRAEAEAQRSGATDAARTILQAERTFREGEVLLKKRDHARAAALFAEAAQANPAEPQYRAYAAWARFDDPKANKKVIARDTIKTLSDALKEQPRFALGHHWLGVVHRHIGETAPAIAAFKEALAQDSNLLDAARELRILQMRQGTGEGQAGLFGRLFKKG